MKIEAAPECLDLLAWLDGVVAGQYFIGFEQLTSHTTVFVLHIWQIHDL
jgi:hypothetical protein